MKTVKLDVFSVVLAVLLIPSLAQSVEGEPSLAATTATPYTPAAIYRGTPAGNQEVETTSYAGAISSFEGSGRESPRIKIFRAEGLSMTNAGNNMFLSNDQLSFTAKALMPRVNGMLSLVSTVRQAKLDSGATQWIQVLSLMATRKINAELAYSARISKNSSIDSAISCNLHPASGAGVADMAAHVQYSIRF